MRECEAVHIDGNYSIYPVELAYGSFVYGFSKPFEEFAKNMGYLYPDYNY